MKTKEVTVSTPKHRLKIMCFSGFIEKSGVKTDKKAFSEMCRTGCINYSQKYSCPPLSPDFNSYVKAKELFVVMLKINLNQFSRYMEYHRLRVGNAVIKPRIEKIMRSLEDEFGVKYIGTGACRLCKPCMKKLDKPCRHPDRMHYSMESLGADCNEVSKKLFGIPLLWYKDKKAPEYTSVICCIPADSSKSKIEESLSRKLDELR